MSESDFRQIFLVMHIEQTMLMEDRTIFLNAKYSSLPGNLRACTFLNNLKNF